VRKGHLQAPKQASEGEIGKTSAPAVHIVKLIEGSGHWHYRGEESGWKNYADRKTTEFGCVNVEAQCESSGNTLVDGKAFKLDKQLDYRAARVEQA
jgi:hypothetical protein